MAFDDNGFGSSARPVRLAGRQADAPAPDAAQNPDFTGVGAPRERTTGHRASYEGTQASDIRRGIDDDRSARGGMRPRDTAHRHGEADTTPRTTHPSTSHGGHRASGTSGRIGSTNRSAARTADRPSRSGRAGRNAHRPNIHIGIAHQIPRRKGPARVGESLRAARAPQPPTSLRRARIAALSVVACALFVFLGSCVFHGTAGIDPDSEFKLIDAPNKPGITFSFSTPRNQWRAGEVPHIYQTDPVWAEKSYAGGTIRKNACGPTCLTMVYVYKTGKTDMTPVEMCAFAERGNYCPTGATEWSFMLYGAASLGLDATQLQVDRDDLEDSLKAGDIVIASVRPGTFTNVGHYIVLHGIDDAGQVTVYDPNSEARSLRKWGIVEILDEVNALWAY